MEMNLYLKNNATPFKKLALLFSVLAMALGLNAQTIFWSDNFDAPAGGANNNNNGAGWNLGTQSGNRWYKQTPNNVSCGGSNNKLYISCPGICAIFGGPNSSVYNTSSGSDNTAQSPDISTVGKTNITLKFSYLSRGSGSVAYGSVRLSSDGGTTWNDLPKVYSNTASCTVETIVLPAQYENITNFRVAFRWRNGGQGQDPPFNVDNIELSIPSVTCPVTIDNSVSTNPTCRDSVNGTITITASPTVPTLTYTINAGSPIVNNTGIFTNLPAGTYTVSVSDGTCATTGANKVLTNPAAVTPSVASNTGPYCLAGNMQLNGTTVTNATYAWTGPNNFAVQAPTKNNLTFADSGTYTLVTTVGGCKSLPTTTRVIINPSLAPPTLGYNSPVCIGDTLKLTATGGTSFSWTGPNGFVSSAQNPARLLTAADTGIYSATATSGTCTSTAATIRVSPAPPLPLPVVGSNNPVCYGDTLKLTATGGTTYTWSGPGGFTSNDQNPVRANFAPADSGNYQVIAQNGSCVSLPSNVHISPAPPLAAPTLGSNSPVCIGDTLKLTATGGTTFTWTGPNNFTSNEQNPTRPYFEAIDTGDYEAIGHIGGCVSIPATIHISPASALPAPVLGSNSPVCAGSDLTFTANTIQGAVYSWIGPDNFTSFDQNPTIPAATTDASGTYAVFVTVGSCLSLPGTIDVVVSPAPVITGNIITNSPVCTADTLRLTAPTIPNATYSWTGPNFTADVQNPTKAFITVSDSGDYTVIATIGNCTSAPATVHISIRITPSAPPVFTNGADTICQTDSTELCVDGDFDGYLWNDLTTFTACKTVKFPGSYWVKVTALNGCIVSSQQFEVEQFGSTSVSLSVKNDTLTSNNGVEYQWFVDNTLIPGATGSVHVAAVSGIYFVRIIDVNGCALYSSNVTVVKVGINEIEKLNVEVYPNPASGSVNISYKGMDGNNIQLSLYSVIGEKVKEQNLSFGNSNNKTIDITSLSKGIYLLQLQQNGKQPYTQKLIVD